MSDVREHGIDAQRSAFAPAREEPPGIRVSNEPEPVLVPSGGRFSRFDRPDVEYQQALYTAVNRALERRPQAVFDLVAVAPSRGSASQAAANTTAARRNAENVLRSLSNMGLPASRVSMSAMSSADAQTSEVHLYVR